MANADDPWMAGDHDRSVMYGQDNERSDIDMMGKTELVGETLSLLGKESMTVAYSRCDRGSVLNPDGTSKMCLVSKGLVECGFKTDLLDLPCELQIETPHIWKSRGIDDIEIVILDMDTGHHTRVMLSCFDVLFGLRLEVLSSSFLIELAKTVCSNHMTKRFSNRFLHEQPRLLTTGKCSPLTFSHFHVSGSQHANLALVSILFEEVNVFSVKQDAHTCRRSISAEPSMLQCFEMLLEHFCTGDNVHGSPDDCLYSFALKFY